MTARGSMIDLARLLAEAVADGTGNRISGLARSLKLDIDVIRDTFTSPDSFRVLEGETKKEITEMFIK